MAESNSDSESSLTGWAVVDDRGECEASDSGSTSSSLEFVQLEENAAVYQRRESKHDSHASPEEIPGQAPEKTTVSADSSTSVDPESAVERPESLGPLDSPSTASNDSSPTPTENELDVLQDEEMRDQTFEPLSRDSAEDPDVVDAELLAPLSMDNPCPEPESIVASLDKSLEELAGDQNQQIELLHAALVRQESDSDSDFVKLDVLQADVLHQMQASGASNTSRASSSSISPSFRFVNPPLVPHPQPDREADEEGEEEDSLIGDFDDRCESDISGVATDDMDDSDLSSMIYAIDDIPLTAGQRLYRHRPNSSLNSILTVISLVALFLAIGIAIGHYIGVSRDDWLRRMQVERMKGAQDNHLMCLKQSDVLRDKLRKLTASYGQDVMGSSPHGGHNVVNSCPGILQNNGAPHGEKKPCAGIEPNMDAFNQNTDQKEPPREGIQNQGTSETDKRTVDVATDAKLQRFIQDLRAQLNQVEVENADLRAEVTRLRYTAHPANAHVNADIAQHQLKVKVNQLASENDDLKSAVGKMRYTVHPPNTQEIADTAYLTEGEPLTASSNNTDVDFLKRKLKNVTEELSAEKKINLFLQGALASKVDTATTAQKKMIPPANEAPSTVLSCVRKHLPEVVSQSARYIDQAGKSTQEFWAKFNEATKDTTTQVIDKWNDLIQLLGKTKIEDLELPVELEKLLQIAWKVEETIKKNLPGVDENSNAQEKAEDQSRNISKPAIAHFQDYVNKTKMTVSELSITLKETWQKVKNLSSDFLTSPEETVQKVQEKIKEKAHAFGDEIKAKWDNVKKNIHPSSWMGHGKKGNHHRYHHHYPKPHSTKHQKPKKFKEDGEQREHQHQQEHQKHRNSERSSEEPSFGGDTPKDFEDKPHHKQRQSSHEQYNDFWNKNEYDPDDFFHEGFFEGNQREWRKHQKRLLHLHGRIHRLNEDILYSMDDDDIEDIYEDLDDLEDDLEDEDQPQTLQTWLACQVRWWKSRLHRKHRSENLIIGCGQQIMQWQLRALCRDRCFGKKCGKRKVKYAVRSLCQQALQSQDSSCLYRGQASQCHTDIKQQKGFHSTHTSQKAHELKHHSQKSSKPKTSPMPMPTQPRSKLPDEEHLFTMDPPNAADQLNDKVNNTAWDQEDEDVTLSPLKLEDASASPSSADRVADQTTEADASWVFERAMLREYHHHNPDWVFERAAERELERNKPWYLSRSEEREYRRIKKQYNEDRKP